ncbi:MAG: SMP-30/gluconolactonase/LRE family protein, partial [Longimicrobiales bacterium]
TIHGDTLWVADMDGVHGFDRRSGAHLRFVDMSEHEPGFINDVDVDGSGVLYATDTQLGRIYRIGAERATIAVEDSMTGPPNGITWDDERAAFLLAPWGGEQRLRTWDPATGAFAEVTTLPGGNFDGIEVVGGGILLASQADSSLHFFDGTAVRTVARVPGRPADIGVDTQRGRVAVPYIALNRVDIWELR